MAYTTDMYAGVPAPGDFLSTVPTRKRMDVFASSPSGGPSAFHATTTTLYAITTDKWAGCLAMPIMVLSH